MYSYIKINYCHTIVISYTVGQFSNTSATQYCITVIDAKVVGGVFNETSDEAQLYAHHIMQAYITIYKCSSKIYNAENEMTLSTSCSLSGSALCRLAAEKL